MSGERDCDPCWLCASRVLLAAFPWIAGEFYINLTSQIFIAAIFAASLNLLVGYGGLPSLGHAAYLGVSAYLSAWLYLKLGLGALGHRAARPARDDADGRCCSA